MLTVTFGPTCQHQRRAEDRDRARGELLEGAAERWRLSMRERVERLKLAARSIVQMAVASTGAWIFAVEVFGHPRPIFAPISAVVVLGLSVGRRLQRAFELALGVAVGPRDRRPDHPSDRRRGVADRADRAAVDEHRRAARLRPALRLPGGDLRRSSSPRCRRAARRRSGASSTRWRAGSSRSRSARSCCRLAAGDAAALGRAAAGRARGDARGRGGRPGGARPRRCRGGPRARARDRRARGALRGGRARGPRDRSPRAAAAAPARPASRPTRSPRPRSISPCATCACWPAARSGRSRSTRTSRRT